MSYEILFCSDAIYKHQVEEAYHEELKAVEELGITYSTFNFDKLVDDGDVEKAIKNVPATKDIRTGIYRGWMLSPENYEILWEALIRKGLQLINNPWQYKNCHHFPYSYDKIKNHSPESVWIEKEKFDINDLQELLKPFSNSPIILKDYVKSEKHFWNEACFCPDAGDTEQVKKVVTNFSNLRDVEGGYVFKEFVELECAEFNSILKTMTAKEYRLFFLNGKVIDCSKYWEFNDYDEPPPIEFFEKIGQKIESKFFTMDVAKKKSGEWIIIELGDGGVSGLPKCCDIKEFYRRLANG